MDIVYGNGTYAEGTKRFEGRIVLDENKLFLRDGENDLTATYIPLEKIARMRRAYNGVELYVRPSAAMGYRAVFRGSRTELTQLVRELVNRLNLKKRLLWPEWVGEVSWR